MDEDIMCQSQKAKESTLNHYDEEYEELRRTDFSGFQHTTQSAVFPVYGTAQTGINCGMFASAMAIYALSSGMHRKSNELRNILTECIVIRKNMILNLAHEMQHHGQMNALSSLGEMYDADRLARTINIFGADKDGHAACGLDNSEPILAKVISFSDIERLEQVVRFARDNHLMVLVPYFAGEEAEPYDPERVVTADEMYRAHWSVIKGEGKGKVSSVEIYEGNLLQTGETYSLDTVFDSNMSLADSLSWERLLEEISVEPDLCAQAKIGLNSRINALLERGETQLPFDFDNEVEKVNLRGRLVVVGIRDINDD